MTLKEEPITETDIVVSERNEALGTKNADPAVYTEGTYAEDGISFKSNSRDGSGMAFYLNDIKEGVTPPSDGAYKPKDISGYSYIKVAVECTSAIALVGLEDGSDWTSAAKATGAWEKESNPNSVRVKDRILFFRISNRDRTAIDAIGIKATVPNAVVKVKSMQLIRRPPEIMPDEEATMFLAVNPS